MLGRWGLPPPHPRIPLRSAFVLQTARYRGQRNAWKVGAAALIPPLSAALGFFFTDGSLPRATKRLARGNCRPQTLAFCCARLLSCRWFATAGNDALGRWELPPLQPPFALRSAFVLQTARYRGQRNTWQVGAAAPKPFFCAALGFCLAEGSLPRATKRWTGGDYRPQSHAFRCARLLSCRRLATAGNETLSRWDCHPPHPPFPLRSAFVLQTARYRGQRTACHPARALAHSYRDSGPLNETPAQIRVILSIWQRTGLRNRRFHRPSSLKTYLKEIGLPLGSHFKTTGSFYLNMMSKIKF